ncbi:MAG: ABC transporter ATP-binding protein, partial [Steroidobacteraceae bacterium]
MNQEMDAPPLALGREVRKSFAVGKDKKERIQALDGVSVEVQRGALTALVGPDGAGKTTLIRLLAGLLTADSGALEVLGFDPAVDPQPIQERIGYMPQKFGLYEDLTVEENLDLYADLHGITADERRERYPQLMQMTSLGDFRRRLAGRLSGGMKQKLGLACTLVRSPQLLLLDEPTVGVDPLSRRELWEIVHHLVHEEGLTALVSTAYLDEAERSSRVIVLKDGKVLMSGAPGEITRLAAGRSFVAEPRTQSARRLQARLLDDPAVIDAVPDGRRVRWVRADASAGPQEGMPVEARFEDGFMVLLRRTAAHEAAAPIVLEHPLAVGSGEVIIAVRDLVKRFGAFTAVNGIHFE